MCVCVCVHVIVCSGVNLLVGTENGLMLLDRSGQGKVYNLITRRRFLQMDVLEGLNVLVTISGGFYAANQPKLRQQMLNNRVEPTEAAGLIWGDCRPLWVSRSTAGEL